MCVASLDRLPADQQPLQVIAPQDKAQGRAMFSLVKIEIVELPRLKPSGVTKVQ